MDGLYIPRLKLAPKPGVPVIVPLVPVLYRLAVLEEREGITAEMAGGPHVEAMRCNQWGYAMLGRGRVLCAAGLVVPWTGRAIAWLLVSREARPRDLAQAFRFAKDAMDKRQRDPFFRRIEAYVLNGAPYQHAMARACGFELEGIMRAFDPLGRDFALYSRVRP